MGLDNTRPARARLLVCGNADWNQGIATNQHYMVRELAAAFDITFTESIGLRRPRLRKQDVQRILARVRRPEADARAPREVPAGTSILRPKTIPIHNRLTHGINTVQFLSLIHI